MSGVPSSTAGAALLLLVLLGDTGPGPAFAGTDVGSVNFTLGSKGLTRDWYLGAPIQGAAGDTLSPGRSEQPALGVEMTWGRAGWPALVAFDVLHSYDDGLQRFPAINLGTLVIPPADVRRRARTLEIALGARRSWLVRGFSPYLGVGGAWVWANVSYEMSDPSQAQFGAPGAVLGGHDSALGYWAGGGLYRRLGPRFQIGIGGRYSKATLKVDSLAVANPGIPESTVLGRDGGYYFRASDTGFPFRGPRGRYPDVNAGGRHVWLVVGWSFPERK